MSKINNTVMECVWPQTDTLAGTCQSNIVSMFTPFRIDYALCGLCLAYVVWRRHADRDCDAKYVRMKYATWVIDYLFMGLSMWFCESFMSFNFTPENVFKHQFVNSILINGIDLFKARLYWNLLPKAKTDLLKHLWKSLKHAVSTVRGMKDNFKFIGKLLSGQGIFTEFDIGKASRRSIRHTIWYIFKVALVVVPLLSATLTKFGLYTCEPLNETIFVFGEGKWYEAHVSRFLKVYLEFVLISFIKDAICMNVMHKLFHNNSSMYEHHATHHLQMKEMSLVNLWYFDLPDVFLEDGCGPLLLMGLKALGGGDCSVHYMSFFLCYISDVNTHSIDPYTSIFWNPLLDNSMRGTLSHHLHHALNKEHYSIWPMHHLVGPGSTDKKTGKELDGFEIDCNMYNNIFDTKFPLEL